MIKLIFSFTFIFWTVQVLASDIVSLEEKLKTAKDSARGVILNELCLMYQIRDPVKALEYGFEGIRLAENLHLQQLAGHLYKSVGVTYIYQSDHPEVARYLLKSLQIFQQLNDKSGEAQAIFSMASM
ncbi:MAG: hypothetical protein WBA74_12420, partial [Cyclobacteriaceae bacterium]